MSQIVVTSGSKFLDIDGYAAIIAYRHLLAHQGEDVIGVSSAPLNESVAPIIREIPLRLDNFEDEPDQQFVVLDVSNPSLFDRVVADDRIIEVVDHHTGYEKYWHGRRHKTKVQIEFIGSVCTMIFDRYQECDKTEWLTADVCKLLIAGILDNTLNLKAGITTDRDRDAYARLLQIGGLDESWGDDYFESCQKVIEGDLSSAIDNDVKIEYVSEFLPEVFGQLLVLDAGPILARKDEIAKVMDGYGSEWVLNLTCLEDGRGYVICSGEDSKRRVEGLFGVKFEGDTMILDQFMLRKEIIKKARAN
ncbi:DHH family phosphoesterase [Candidatus Saccharibacteria bacterium]|nr:DHH family phosphoesterase [Candidatus Saccharibacteria bacterium]